MWFFGKSKKSEQDTNEDATAKNQSTEQNKREFVGIRMEAIGGQGAHSAGKILAEVAVLKSGYTGNHFSSFGSEKRGSPVRSYVRFSTIRKPIRSASSIAQPELLVIYHAALLKEHPEILEGVGPSTDILINSSDKKIQLPIRPRSLTVVNATEIALKNKCGLNTVMLGAAAKLLPELQVDALRSGVLHFFSRLNEQQKAQNSKGFDQGLSQAKNITKDLKVLQEESPLGPRSTQSHPGYLNAPIGGVIVNPGNTILKDNSVSRKGVAPQFLKEACCNCGYCDMVCPDFCFVWEKGADGRSVLKGLDYQYCKACQKCIVACPTQALVPVAESEISEAERALKVHAQTQGQEGIASWNWSQLASAGDVEALMKTPALELLNPKSYLRPSVPEYQALVEKLKEEKKK